MSSPIRKRSAIAALLMAAIALVLALPSFASADPLGEISEFSVTGTPASPAFGLEGKLWFVNRNFPNALGRFDPTTHTTERIEVTGGLEPEESELKAVAPGPEGDMWFTEVLWEAIEGEYVPSIGKINPTTKAVTHYTSGFAAGQYPLGLTAGPDGNIWFTQSSFHSQYLGRITTSGTVTEFKVTTGYLSEETGQGITAGPDGNVWFTTEGTATIGRITPSGEITQFSTGLNAGAKPQAITVGPDGNLWFTDTGATKAVGKITPSGEITEYSIGSVFSNGIATGNDGKLWVSGGSRLLQITTSGSTTEFSEGLQAGANVRAVAAGPEGEGNIWFTDLKPGATKVGKIGTEEEAPIEGPPLTLNIEEGSGTVVSNPAGLECTGSSPHSCTTEEVAEGTVTLTASPAAGYAFKGWKKCDGGGVNGRQCTINLNAAKEVGAKFTKVWSLTASKASGSGSLTSSPGGVSCSYTCTTSTAAYKPGSLTVKEKPNKHFHFVEFKGGTGSATSCDGNTSESCTFSIGADSSIEAAFAEDAKHTLSYSAEGGGQGLVKTKPAGIVCSYTCSQASAEFFASEEAEVSVTLGKGTSSVTWTTSAGTCTGNALSCKVPMSADHSLVAKFE